MNANDRTLGMDRPISRRDFVNGVSAAATGALLRPTWALAMEDGQDFAPEQGSAYYPPALTGMRGDHAGSFEVAHALRDRRSVDVSAATHTGETYDLVVVSTIRWSGCTRPPMPARM
jgi:spermidine dehydrogenase